MSHTSKASLDVTGMAAVFALLLRIAFKAIPAVCAGRDNSRFTRQFLPVPVPPLGSALVRTESLLLPVFRLGNGLTALCTKTELRNKPELRLRFHTLSLTKRLDGIE
jgi:hypothetical protein